MKRRLITVLAVLLCVCFALTGCGSKSFSKVKVTGDAQKTNYIVRSNGGNAVQYGNYVYFINGTRGYEDTDAKQNEWGKVVKGALYRAELNGTASGNEFVSKVDSETKLEFKSTVGKDYDDKDINVVNTQLIAPKTIGTSGYSDGGIFIFDNYVYYATPNNEKDKSGKTQIARTDFMRSRLDGTKTELIYSTDADSASSPYQFYKQNGSVFLVSYFNSKIVSVQMTEKKISKPKVIAENVTSVVFPTKSVYDKNAPTNSPEDFIYYTRAVTDSDAQRAGNVVEIVRPNGEENGIYLQLGKDVTLEACRDGLLFYRVSDAGGSMIVKFDNLHNYLYNNSASYKASEDAKTMDKIAQIDGSVFLENNLSTYTTTYCFRPNMQSNIAYMLGISPAGLFRFSNDGEAVKILSKEIALYCVDNGFVYFAEKDTKMLKRVEIFGSSVEETVSHADMVTSGIKADVVNGMVVYFAKLDTWADGYAFFKRVNEAEGASEQFVGVRAKADVKPKDEEKKDEETKPESEASFNY